MSLSPLIPPLKEVEVLIGAKLWDKTHGVFKFNYTSYLLPIISYLLSLIYYLLLLTYYLLPLTYYLFFKYSSITNFSITFATPSSALVAVT